MLKLPLNECGVVYKISLDKDYKGNYIEELISGRKTR
ncbi:MAG: hypothetical protein KatS3mg068_0856 [Candidatus Sericytochromatia bacterium]|nr:MAG: hypothetical protein KatS3mg068_0856 [Candidatus Sericytochromatia bacterium]